MSTPTSSHMRSSSRTRNGSPPPRPTTPLRPPSRSSLRSSHTPGGSYNADADSANTIASLEPAFAELSDAMADLEANFVHLQLLHESVARFNECFASFLYGLNVNAFCVDFPEAPVAESFKRYRENRRFTVASHSAATDASKASSAQAGLDPDQTFMTSDTSFVDNPPSTIARNSAASSRGIGHSRGATTRGSRASGVPRGTTRGTTGRGRSSGLARPRYGSRGSIR